MFTYDENWSNISKCCILLKEQNISGKKLSTLLNFFPSAFLSLLLVNLIPQLKIFTTNPINYYMNSYNGKTFVFIMNLVI